MFREGVAMIVQDRAVTDEELLARFRAGDSAAFGVLYERHIGRVRRICLRRFSDRYEAEDIAQEAFAAAMIALRRNGNEIRFGPWIAVIASHLCVDHARRSGRVQPVDVVDDLAESVDDPVLDDEELRAVRIAFARVNERHREVLALREFAGLSYEQIAQRLGVPSTTVRPLLQRARESLRRAFDDAAAGARGVFVPLGGVIAGVRAVGRDLGKHGPVLDQTASALVAATLATVVIAGSAATPPNAPAVISGPSKVVEHVRTPLASGSTLAPPARSVGAEVPRSPATAPPPDSPQRGGHIMVEAGGESDAGPFASLSTRRSDASVSGTEGSVDVRGARSSTAKAGLTLE